MLRLAEESATLALGRVVASVVRPGTWIRLEGPLGAGKTTLARGLARGLGLDPEIPVTSPTFALVQVYPTVPPFVHGDLYRLGHPAELEDLGLLESLEEGAIVALEWAEAFVPDLGPPALTIELAPSASGGREAHMDGPLADFVWSAVAATPGL